MGIENKESKEVGIRLVRNSVGQVLEAIILSRRVRAVTLLDQVSHIIRRFAIRLVEDEPVLKVLDCLGLEAGKTKLSVSPLPREGEEG